WPLVDCTALPDLREKVRALLPPLPCLEKIEPPAVQRLEVIVEVVVGFLDGARPRDFPGFLGRRGLLPLKVFVDLGAERRTLALPILDLFDSGVAALTDIGPHVGRLLARGAHVLRIDRDRQRDPAVARLAAHTILKY